MFLDYLTFNLINRAMEYLQDFLNSHGYKNPSTGGGSSWLISMIILYLKLCWIIDSCRSTCTLQKSIQFYTFKLRENSDANSLDPRMPRTLGIFTEKILWIQARIWSIRSCGVGGLRRGKTAGKPSRRGETREEMEIGGGKFQGQGREMRREERAGGLNREP